MAPDAVAVGVGPPGAPGTRASAPESAAGQDAVARRLVAKLALDVALTRRRTGPDAVFERIEQHSSLRAPTEATIGGDAARARPSGELRVARPQNVSDPVHILRLHDIPGRPPQKQPARAVA